MLFQNGEEQQVDNLTTTTLLYTENEFSKKCSMWRIPISEDLLISKWKFLFGTPMVV